MTATTTNGLIVSLQSAPHDFLQPSLPLYTDAVAYLKNILDPLAKDVSEEQQERLQAARKKRKRGEDVVDGNVLRLKQIHTDGFGTEQVWEQARRVIDAAREEAQQGLEKLQPHVSATTSSESEDLGDEGVDYEVEGVDEGTGQSESEEDEEDGEDRGLEDQILEDDEDFDVAGHDDFDDLENDEAEDGFDNGEPPAEFVSDKFGLNDGFFSIDDFNKQSEFLEQQDARGDDDGAASDEEDVDWDADPKAQAQAEVGKGAAEESADEDEEDGPTFGDPDASSEDEEDIVDGDDLDMGGMGNTNDIMYADFFAPPAQKKRKNKKGRPNPHNFPGAGGKSQEGPADMERTIAAVHRDLFEDESDEDEEEAEADKKPVDHTDPRSRLSTHERRKVELAEEIRKLEAANVAKREWTLSGEARAADRPVNSLLEENLDFERAGKPIPVVTAEVSESIEELIKRRILAHDFQDILRRRPDDLGTGKDGRRGRVDFELEDSKSKKGLAEEYEEEYSKQMDPNYVDIKDEKLAKEQKEIERLWREVCGQLDSLSSWHFRPRQPVPQLDIRVDAPAVTMEDARPTAGGEVAGASQLAPQEVYKGGESSNKKEEVAGKSGLPSAREEMSREDKKRRRRREKERIRKAGGSQEGKTESRAAKEKKEVLGDLKRGGVKVIGKKGDMKDVEGRDVGDHDAGGQGASRYKL